MTILRLSPHFTLGEFTRSDTAQRLGLDNTPSTTHLANLYLLANTLERVRKVLGNNPILISSGYRSYEVNRAVGGVPNSNHTLGLAADFTCPGYGDVYSVCVAIHKSGIPFDQLIFEQGRNSHWVHFAIGDRMRDEVLSWSPLQGYVRGLHHLR